MDKIQVFSGDNLSLEHITDISSDDLDKISNKLAMIMEDGKKENAANTSNACLEAPVGVISP